MHGQCILIIFRYFSIFPPYRAGVCNYINSFLQWGSVVNIFLGYLKAIETHNAYIVDNNLSILLAIIWLAILGCSIASLVLIIIFSLY